MAGDSGATDEAVPLKYIVKHSSEIMGMSWTHAGDGLLVSGKAGDIAMQEIPHPETQSTLPKPHR